MTYLVSDKKTDYAQFISETLQIFEEHDIQGIAVVALTGDHKALTGYWNMDLHDKLQAESEIRFDALDAFLIANAGRYCGPDENEEEGEYASD